MNAETFPLVCLMRLMTDVYQIRMFKVWCQSGWNPKIAPGAVNDNKLHIKTVDPFSVWCSLSLSRRKRKCAIYRYMGSDHVLPVCTNIDMGSDHVSLVRETWMWTRFKASSAITIFINTINKEKTLDSTFCAVLQFCMRADICNKGNRSRLHAGYFLHNVGYKKDNETVHWNSTKIGKTCGVLTFVVFTTFTVVYERNLTNTPVIWHVIIKLYAKCQEQLKLKIPPAF